MRSRHQTLDKKLSKMNQCLPNDRELFVALQAEMDNSDEDMIWYQRVRMKAPTSMMRHLFQNSLGIRVEWTSEMTRETRETRLRRS